MWPFNIRVAYKQQILYAVWPACGVVPKVHEDRVWGKNFCCVTFPRVWVTTEVMCHCVGLGTCVRKPVYKSGGPKNRTYTQTHAREVVGREKSCNVFFCFIPDTKLVEEKMSAADAVTVAMPDYP